MVSRKYTKDYRLENVLDERGRLITRPVYCGKRYFSDADPATLRRTRIALCTLIVLYWVVFVVGLVPASGAMRHWYVSIPYFCCFLPAVFLSGSIGYFCLYTLRPATEGLTREQKDRLYERLSPCSFMTLLLGALAAVGETFYLIWSREDYSGSSDIILIVSIVVMIGASIGIFSLRQYTKMQFRE